MNFNFTGRSRESRLQLASDTTKGRDENLAALRRAREKREAEARANKAATTIQRHFRGFRCRRTLHAEIRNRLRSGDMTLGQMIFSVRFLPAAERAAVADQALAMFLVRDGTPQQLATSPCLLKRFFSDVVLPIVNGGSCDDARLECIVTRVAETLEACADDASRFALQAPVVQLVRCVRGKQQQHQRANETSESKARRLVRDAFFYISSGRLAEKLDVDAVRHLANGDPLGGTCGGVTSPEDQNRDAENGLTLGCLLLGVNSFRDESDARRFDDVVLEALGTATNAASAITFMRLLLAGDGLASAAALGGGGGGGDGSDSGFRNWAALELRLRAVRTQMDAASKTAIVEALIAALSGTDDGESSKFPDPLKSLYAPRTLSLFASLCAAITSVPASCPAADPHLQQLMRTLDLLSSLYINPWLAVATNPAAKRLALPLISKIAHAKGVLRALWSVASAKCAVWARKDGRGSLIIEFPSITVLFCYALVHYVDSTDFSHSMRVASGALTESEARSVVVTFRDLVARAHMQGCATDDGTRAFARASHTLLARLHIVDESDSFMPSAEWLASSSGVAFPQFLTMDEWREGLLAEDGVVEESSSSSDDDDDEESGDARVFALRGLRRGGQFARSGGGGGGGGPAARKGKKAVKEFDPTQSVATRTVQLLQHAPFLVPFPARIVYFSSLMVGSSDGFAHYWGSDEVVVERSDVFQSAFLKLGGLTPEQIMGRTRVRFLDDNGMLEEGFGEGVYRDFVSSVCAMGFAPQSGLFERTPQGFVYPRPFTEKFVGPDHLRRFEFLGKMLGKALRQGILLDVPFAPFFRNSLLGRTNGINELRSLDEEIYTNLIKLRSATADELDSFGLTFTVTQDVLGVVTEVPLIPNGGDVAVTSANVMPYIHLLADYKLNRVAKRQVDAFRAGLEQLVDPKWLRFFDSNELQLLFQGREEEIGLDVADWRANTTYAGAADPTHPSILLFWRVVESMTPAEQRKLLKFATSTSRAPLLGFRHMSPQFNITLYEDSDRLPSAATCFCTIKLPAYKTFEKMREKLLMAIEVNTFGMS